MTTDDQTRNEYIEAMGRELGEVFHALGNDLLWLHAKWALYYPTR